MMKKQLTNKEIEEIAYLRALSLLLPNNNNYNLNRGSSHLTTSNNQLTNNHNVNIKMEKEEEDGSDAGLMQRAESSSRRSRMMVMKLKLAYCHRASFLCLLAFSFKRIFVMTTSATAMLLIRCENEAAQDRSILLRQRRQRQHSMRSPWKRVAMIVTITANFCYFQKQTQQIMVISLLLVVWVRVTALEFG